MNTPKSIYMQLCEKVVAQDSAKRTLSVAIYNHFIRCQHPEAGIEKSNVLMLGPTGCGKTLMLETIANMLDIPVAFGDATLLTQAGYVGQDCEQLLSRLLQAANNDIERAQRGIIFIDEIDKIGRKQESPTSHRDASGEGVQQALLTMIHGAIVDVPVRAGYFDNSVIQINTKNILFVCSGAFEGLANNHNVSVQDIIKFGIIPELAGRLPVICKVHPLSASDLYTILAKGNNALVNQYKKLFSLSNCELDIEDKALRLIADYAKENGTGARGLRAILENTLQSAMFQFGDISYCKITPDNVHAALQTITIAMPPTGGR